MRLPVILLCLILLCFSCPGSAQTNYSGKEFHLALGGYTFGSISDRYCYDGTIILMSKHQATAQLTFNFNSTVQTYTVQPGLPTYIYLTPTETGWISNLLVDQIDNKSLRITSDSNITVQFGNRETANEDAMTVLPSDAQDIATEYYGMSLRGGSAGNFGVFNFTIVANCNVELEITPSAQSYSHSANVPFTVTLNKGEVFQLGTPFQSSPGKDLSGSLIKVLNASCCFPINVFTTGPTNYAKYPQVTSTFLCCADQLMEQLLPSDWWTKEYPVVPMYKNSKSMLRIISRTNGNVIKFDNIPVATLNQGQIFDTVIFHPTVVTADSNFGMAHFMLSDWYDADYGQGDPDMVWCYPMSRGITEAYIPLVRPMGFADTAFHYATIISETSNVPAIMLDNAPIGALFQSFPNNPIYQYVHLELDTSVTHHLVSGARVTAFYGVVYSQGSYVLPMADINGIAGSAAQADTIRDTIVLCAADSVILSGDTLIGNPQWSTGATTPTITVTETGVYTLTENTVCPTYTRHYIFNVAFLTFNVSDTFLCKGDSVQLALIGDPMFSYNWSPGIGLSDSTVLNPVIKIDTTTTFTVTARYPQCPDITKTLTVEVDPTPIVSVGNDTASCNGDAIMINAVVSPGWYSQYTYQWDFNTGINDLTNPDIIFHGVSDTMLKLTVTTKNGCIGSDSINIKIADSVIATVNPVDTAICPGATVSYKVQGGVSYTWVPPHFIDSPRSATPVATPVSGMNYTVYVTDVYGCKDTLYTSIDVHPGGLLHLPDSVSIYPGESYQMDPQGNCLYFSWFPPLGLTNTIIANPIASPPVNTRYIVTATTENGCPAIDSIDVYVKTETVLDIPNAFVPGSGPNGELKIVKRGIATLKTFQVYNRWGNKVFETSDIEQGWDGRFNGEPQPMGVYVVIVEAYTNTGRRFYKQGNVTLIR